MLNHLCLSALRALAHAVPAPVGYALSRCGAHLHYRLARTKRDAVLANLRQVAVWRDGDVSSCDIERLARRTFRNHGVLLFEWLRAGGGTHVEFRGLEHLERAVGGGRGAIIATCHLGNWELAAIELARRGVPLHVVTGEQLGRLGAAVRREKARLGIRVVRPVDGMRPLYRALAGGEVVVLLIDGDIYRRGCETRFFARSTRLPFGAARLAHATGAALLPATMIRVGPRAYRARLHAPVDAGSDRADAAATMRAVLGALEPAIAAHPDEWCLFRPLWNGRHGGRSV